MEVGGGRQVAHAAAAASANGLGRGPGADQRGFGLMGPDGVVAHPHLGDAGLADGTGPVERHHGRSAHDGEVAVAPGHLGERAPVPGGADGMRISVRISSGSGRW